jgi:hypothetical protein
MHKLAYWSLICYPLALMFAVEAVIMIALGHNYPAIGLATLALYMLYWQFIWAVSAGPKTPSFYSFGSILFTLGAAFSTGLILIVSSFSDVIGNWILIGSLLTAIAGPQLSSACEYFFSRAKKGEEGG